MLKRSLSEIVPVAPLKIIALDSIRELGQLVDRLLAAQRHSIQNDNPLFSLGYKPASYLIDFDCPRFGSGEGKSVLNESIRGADIFILSDVMNHTISYSMNSKETKKSPDDLFLDLKRVILACSGQAHRLNVIIPFLYEGRQNKRDKFESLDSALSLMELSKMGVNNIITFDAHEPRVQNAIPIKGFDNFSASYQFIRALLLNDPDVIPDKQHLMVISPRESAMDQAVYYASVLGIDMGLIHKRWNAASEEWNENDSVTSIEYLGNQVAGKDVFIIDDMISSGTHILESACLLKSKHARKVFIAATYGLFTNGLDHFDNCYKKGMIDKVFTTNLTYVMPELKKRPYYYCVDLSNYLALIIDTLNNDTSVNEILDPSEKIHELLTEYRC